MTAPLLTAGVDVGADRLEVTVYAQNAVGADTADAQDPIICTVAQPRGSAMTGVYMGEELNVRSTRPGAYDAMAIKSLFNGQKRDPLAPKEPAPCKQIPETPLSPLSVAPIQAPKPRNSGPARAFPTVQREKPSYRPQTGSLPYRVIEHLRAFGGFITHFEIAEKFGVVRTSITAIFKPATKGGALVRHMVGGYVGFALPGWTPPAVEKPAPAASSEPPPPADDMRAFLATFDSKDILRPSWPPAGSDPEEASARYELLLREHEKSLLISYIAVLQLRMQLNDVARLFPLPLPPLTEPSRLSAAA